MQPVNTTQKRGFGASAVFLTAISAILGAILFLRFGFATGTLGFWGVIGIIIIGHAITISTALAIAELATNTRVEGGGEYFIISRSFGLKIGSTIGITLFFSQTISIAFYVIASAESFQFLYEFFQNNYNIEIPRQVISIPTMFLLAFVLLKQGAGSGIKLLYIVNVLLFIALALFFAGKPVAAAEGAAEAVYNNFGFFEKDRFFYVFAICFPAFTGVTAGVGLSGDLRNPGKAIPIGTLLGTITGLVVYVFVVWKFAVSAPASDLVSNALIMSKIAIFGDVVVPIGLSACTLSAALGCMLVAPRTLQAISIDKMFPFKRLNDFLSKGHGETNEPRNASIVVFTIAFFFILLGDINSVAEIITMFFLITYGSLCLNSFLNHFGSPPSYRPRFKSKWYISLAGFVLSIWVMMQISPVYSIFSYIVITLIYIFIEHFNKDSKGLVNIFKGALFQLNRHLQVYMQKHQSGMDKEEWRPATICISAHSFEREKVLELMKWLSYKHGFGTYFHYIEGYFNLQTYQESRTLQKQLIEQTKDLGGTLYIDTMISPSYTSAIAQVIQTPSISGMENNFVLFEYDKRNPSELSQILKNVNLARAGNYDIGIFAISEHFVKPKYGIHVWMNEDDTNNINFMILMSYIIMSHPDWKKSRTKIFLASCKKDFANVEASLKERIAAGRLPITLANIEFVILEEKQKLSDLVVERSSQAALLIVGFSEDIIIQQDETFFTGFKATGDILFVNTVNPKEII